VVGGGVDVDVVDADAGPADDDEVRRRGQHLLGDFGARTDDQRVGVGDGVKQCLPFHVVGSLDVVARPPAGGRDPRQRSDR